ncbi:MAG: hypothetical protein ACYTF0_07555 [Planctomycetota bacterium]|jgi:hypothetical protein
MVVITGWCRLVALLAISVMLVANDDHSEAAARVLVDYRTQVAVVEAEAGRALARAAAAEEAARVQAIQQAEDRRRAAHAAALGASDVDSARAREAGGDPGRVITLADMGAGDVPVLVLNQRLEPGGVRLAPKNYPGTFVSWGWQNKVVATEPCTVTLRLHYYACQVRPVEVVVDGQSITTMSMTDMSNSWDNSKPAAVAESQPFTLRAGEQVLSVKSRGRPVHMRRAELVVQ